ncbi:MAG: DUF1016 N-terminal domain-containing protein [bacterium]
MKQKEEKLLSPTGRDYHGLLADIAGLLAEARRQAALSVNAVLTATYWLIGRRIVEFEQKGKKRAEYGAGLLEHLSTDLRTQFGRGFSPVNLSQMKRFYILWPEQKIFQTLSEKSQTLYGKSISRRIPGEFEPTQLAEAFPLPWSAYVRLMTVKDKEARGFYEAEALRGGWSVRQLDRQISSQFYERTLLSRNKASMLKKGAVARYALEGLPSKVIASEYKLALPDEKQLAEEMNRTRRMLEARRKRQSGETSG